MPVLIGSTQVALKWNYTLSPGSQLLLTTFFIDDGTRNNDIGVISHMQNITTVFNNYRARFAISRSEVATLIINRVTERENTTFQCKIVVLGNSWVYKIRVLVNFTGENWNVQ